MLNDLIKYLILTLENNDETIYTLIASLFFILFTIFRLYKHLKLKKQLRDLLNSQIELSPEAFFKMRNQKNLNKKGYVSSSYQIKGVYVLYNATKNMYYVGQGINIINRVNSHLNGSGNGDVYADYKYGDKFTIKLISLDSTEFKSLNELEKNLISYYNSYKYGYNKTKGNN